VGGLVLVGLPHVDTAAGKGTILRRPDISPRNARKDAEE
jgi:hypothetical protein